MKGNGRKEWPRRFQRSFFSLFDHFLRFVNERSPQLKEVFSDYANNESPVIPTTNIQSSATQADNCTNTCHNRIASEQ